MMPPRFHPRALFALLMLVGTLSFVPTTGAKAHPMTKSDANDTKGPLDLASVSVEHVGEGDLIYRFETRRPFDRFDLGQRSYFALAFDTDEDGDADRCAFIYNPSTGLRGQLTDCARRVYYSPRVSRSGSKGAEILLSSSSLGGTHRWAAISIYERDDPCTRRACVDQVPNRASMFHDLVPPRVKWITTLSDDTSFALSSTTTIPLEVSIRDKDTRVKGWMMERRLPSGDWEFLDSGSDPGPAVTANVDLQEGQQYILRVSGIDKHDNVGYAPGWLILHVPFDDLNASAEFSTGWTYVEAEGYFQGGYHTTSTAGATVSFTVTGQPGLVARIRGESSNGHATFQTESGDIGSAYGNEGPGPSATVAAYAWGGSGGTTTLTLTVTDGTWIIDRLELEF